MAKRKTLGRGLSNLIPSASGGRARPQPDSGRNDFRDLPLSEIQPDPKQPRKTFDQKELEGLAATLKSVGVIEPVIVRPIDSGYQLISGERRWRAAKIAGFKKIPAVLKQVSDLQALEMGIIENIQREELNPIEEARAYQQWMAASKLKASDIAKKVGKDRSTITNLIRLLKLPDLVLELIEKKALSPGQARPLIGIADKATLVKLTRKIVAEGWTARRVEDEVARLQNPSAKKGGKAAPKKDANIRKLEDRLRRRLKAKVSISHKANGSGSISLHYANLDDLDRLLELLDKK